MKLDLHIHTTSSDGTDAPAQIVRLAQSSGITAIAITDHDTLGGLNEALSEGARVGLRVIPGCEISSGGVSEVHVLGYGLTPDCGIDETLADMRNERQTRMEEMLKKLSDVGIEIDMAQIKRYTNGPVGRAHLARALLEGGYVTSIKDAFNRYLAPGAAAYVPRRKLETRNVITMIRDCGGVPGSSASGQRLHGHILAGRVPARLEEERSYGRGGVSSSAWTVYGESIGSHGAAQWPAGHRRQ